MRFCTGCGRPREDGAKFCTSCGTPATSDAPVGQFGAAGLPATAVASAPAVEREPSAPVSTPEPQLLMPESRSGPPVLVIVGIILVVLIGAGVGTILYLRHDENTATMKVDKATSPTSAPSETDIYIHNLNLGSYPGATAAAVTDESAGDVIAAFKTRDNPQQVIGYYKVRFPVADATNEEGKSELRAALPNGQHILIHAEAQTDGTQVRIVREP